MSLPRAEHVWQGSHAHRIGSAGVRRFVQSRSLACAMRVLNRVIAWLEQCGIRVSAVGLGLPQPVAVFLLLSVCTTLLVRGMLVGMVGQEDGRWWVPPGLIMLWGAILVADAHQRHPEMWRGSRMRGWLRRCLQRPS